MVTWFEASTAFPPWGPVASVKASLTSALEAAFSSAFTVVKAAFPSFFTGFSFFRRRRFFVFLADFRNTFVNVFF
jgi:hypothetical protein